VFLHVCFYNCGVKTFTDKVFQLTAKRNTFKELQVMYIWAKYL
jgi:hypothetical protein